MNRHDRKGNCRAEAAVGFPDLSHVVGKNYGLGAGWTKPKNPYQPLR
jgi:hypothetical protein